MESRLPTPRKLREAQQERERAEQVEAAAARLPDDLAELGTRAENITKAENEQLRQRDRLDAAEVAFEEAKEERDAAVDAHKKAVNAERGAWSDWFTARRKADDDKREMK